MERMVIENIEMTGGEMTFVTTDTDDGTMTDISASIMISPSTYQLLLDGDLQMTIDGTLLDHEGNLVTPDPESHGRGILHVSRDGTGVFSHGDAATEGTENCGMDDPTALNEVDRNGVDDYETYDHIYTEPDRTQDSTDSQPGTDQASAECKQNVNKAFISKELPDLNNPITIGEDSVIMIGGKRCMVKTDPENGQLKAYPLKALRRPGRPRKYHTEEEKAKAVRHKKMERTSAVDMREITEETNNAAEGLLELANTMCEDGIRRSNRKRVAKPATELSDLSEEDDEDEESYSKKMPQLKEWKPHPNLLRSSTVSQDTASQDAEPAVKRGRGRPRRYPRPQDVGQTQVPMLLLPASSGSTLIMAPAQGTQALSDLKKHLASLPLGQSNLPVSTSHPLSETFCNLLSQDNAKILRQFLENSTGKNVQLLRTNLKSQKSTTENSEVARMNLTRTENNDGECADKTVSGSTQNDSSTRGKMNISQEESGLSVLNSSKDTSLASDTQIIKFSAAEISTARNLKTCVSDKKRSDFARERPIDENSVTETEKLVDSVNVLNPRENESDKLGPDAKCGALEGEGVGDTDNGSNGGEVGGNGTDASCAVIQLPNEIVDAFMKKDLVKIGLRLSEGDLAHMKCSLCGHQSYMDEYHQAHIAASHHDCVQRCAVCWWGCLDKDELVAHFRDKHPRCVCSECNFLCQRPSELTRHKMSHAAHGWHCAICNKNYKDAYVLKSHNRLVHNPPNVMYQCDICLRKYLRKSNLKRHLRTHSAKRPYKCPHCDYTGTERSDINKHIVVHSAPQFACPTCHKKFRHRPNMELHIKRKHNGLRDYKCGVCNFYGYTFTDIRKHIERKHTSLCSPGHVDKPTCSRCGIQGPSAFMKTHEPGCDGCKVTVALDDDQSIQRERVSPEPSNEAEVTIDSQLLTSDGVTADGDRCSVLSLHRDSDIDQEREITLTVEPSSTRSKI